MIVISTTLSHVYTTQIRTLLELTLINSGISTPKLHKNLSKIQPSIIDLPKTFQIGLCMEIKSQDLKRKSNTLKSVLKEILELILYHLEDSQANWPTNQLDFRESSLKWTLLSTICKKVCIIVKKLKLCKRNNTRMPLTPKKSFSLIRRDSLKLMIKTITLSPSNME